MEISCGDFYQNNIGEIYKVVGTAKSFIDNNEIVIFAKVTDGIPLYVDKADFNENLLTPCFKYI